MNQVLFIFIGGGLGSLARYYLNRAFAGGYFETFPVGTLSVNILASLLLGLFLGFVDVRNFTNESVKLLVAVGFCGGFSTFSTFSAETLILLKSGQGLLAFLNVVVSVLCCLAATFMGIFVARYI
jgi:fluoride exporter